jgi:hypothetical protein
MVVVKAVVADAAVVSIKTVEEVLDQEYNMIG